MTDRYTEPDLASSALVTIDVQRDVLDGGALAVPGTSDVLPALVRLAAGFRASGRPIVHMVRLYRPDGTDVDLCRRAGIEDGASVLCPGTPGAELAPGLAPAGTALDTEALLAGGIQEIGRGEVVVLKPRWGAFYRTPLADHLAGLGLTTLVFAGANFPNCPRTSIFEASERDYRIAVAQDALSGLYDQGRAELAAIGVALADADSLLAGL